MRKKFYLITLSFVSIYFIACTKYTTPSSNTNTSTTTIDTAPSIKFFDAMDFGSMDVTLNSKKVSSVAKYYASSYITAKEGSNNLQLAFPGKSSVLNATVDLVRNTKYSCFFYMVGNEWKYNLVKDDINGKSNASSAAIRVLDFRTQGYYDYINVRIASPGGDDFDQKNRNFLDHGTYSGFTYFKSITAGTYSIKTYNDTATTSRRFDVKFESKGIYTVMLTTPINITPYSAAIFQIFPDVIKHN